MSTSSSYISSPLRSGQTMAQSQSPRASPTKTARSSGTPETCQSAVGRPLAPSTLACGGLCTSDGDAGIGSRQPGEAGAEADAQFLGHQDQLPGAAQRARAPSRPRRWHGHRRGSSPAWAIPLNSQPTGSGQGIHTGTSSARATATVSASTLGGNTG